MTRRIGPLALTRGNLFWLTAYLVTVTGVILGLFAFRNWALVTYGTDAKEADWQEWQATVAKQAAGEGPVVRRPPKRTKPPGFVLMNDYFAVCLAGAVVICSALFATFMFMLRGACAPPPAQHRGHHTLSNEPSSRKA